jgi:hypothetical protein
VSIKGPQNSILTLTFIFQGYLQFKRETKFHKRWMVLKGNMLFYFDKKGDKEPLGLLLLEGKIFIRKITSSSMTHFRTRNFQDAQSNSQQRKNLNSIALNYYFSTKPEKFVPISWQQKTKRKWKDG